MSDHRKRPPRLTQIFSCYDPPVYFVTMTTWSRQALLANESVHDAFRRCAGQQAANGVAVGRYVLMPDHMHLFVRIGHDRRLNESIKFIKQAITKELRKSNSGLQVWQPGFFDHLLRNHESYASKWDYVIQNPVRKGLVKSAAEWPYQGEIVRIELN